MDANGLRVWTAASAAAFRLDGGAAQPVLAADGLDWHAATRSLRLASRGPLPQVALDPVRSRAAMLLPRPVRDPGGGFAWWDAGAGAIEVAGFGEGAIDLAVPTDVPPGIATPTDLAFAGDILFVARNAAVLMIDRRDRWPPVRVTATGFDAHRLAPAAGGVWALDRTRGTLARLRGQPLTAGGIDPHPAAGFAAVAANPRRPKLTVRRGVRIPDEAVDLATSAGGRVAVLAWRGADDAVLYELTPAGLVRRFALAGLRAPHGIAFVGEDRIAVLALDGAAAARQVFVYDLDATVAAGEATAPTGDLMPLVAPFGPGLFANAASAVPAYASGAAAPETMRPLRAVSRAAFAATGAVIAGPFDSGADGFVWHRLNLEAAIPAGTGIRIDVLASDADAVPDPAAPDWMPHVAGDAARLDDVPDAPQAAWCPGASEHPFHPGVLACAPEPGRSGRFTLLLQRPGRQVRRVAGRRLWLRVTLLGDGRTTPCLAALRVWGGRLSYRDRYLPALYHETLGGPDADAALAASPADFLERLLLLFEGRFTEIEDQVAAAWLLTDAAAAPAAALPWLARWIGIDSADGDDPERLRQTLRAAPYTAGLNGTLGGLNAALEIATGGRMVAGGRLDPNDDPPAPGERAHARIDGGDGDIVADVLALSTGARGGPIAALAGGAVTRGAIVVVEGWRLRRVVATILGADLADEADPLSGAFAVSGNSIVGDTLILGEEAARRTVLALFRGDLPKSVADRVAVDAFFERLAHRVMVLVRDTPATRDRDRLRAVAAAAAPAHVEVTLLPADRALIVGAASLVGIDTWLGDRPPVGRVRVGATRIGLGDRVQNEGRLDPRADGPAPVRPTAVADGPSAILSGSSFILSAARSSAAEGRRIARNIWTRT